MKALRSPMTIDRFAKVLDQCLDSMIVMSIFSESIKYKE
jgi:hypothetical protein